MASSTGKPKSELIMDGILHNLQRREKQQLARDQKRAQREEIAKPVSTMEAMTDSNLPVVKSSINEGNTNDITAKKGILKTPTVRFPDLPDEPYEEVPSAFSPASYPEFVHFPPPPPPPEVYHPPPEEAPPPPEPRGIDLFDPAIDHNDYLSENAYRLYTKFMDELAEFVEIQGEVIRYRLAVQEKRQYLKLLREEIARCDGLLMDHLRHCKAEGLSFTGPIVDKLFKDAELRRDEAGPVEAEYEPMEVKLGADEWRLREKYSLIEGRFENYFRLKATSTTAPSEKEIQFEKSSAGSVSIERNWIGGQPREIELFQGAFIGGKVRVGQLPLIAPDTTGVRMIGDDDAPITYTSDPRKETDSLESNGRRGPTSTPPVDDANEEIPTDLLGLDDADPQSKFADSGPDTRAQRIHLSLTGIGDLGGLAVDHGPLLDEFAIDEGLGEGDSLLIRSDDSGSRSTLSDYLMSFESTQDRINRWILHQLRVSPRQVYALRRNVVEKASGTPDWATLALSFWSSDLMGSDVQQKGSIDQIVDEQVPLKSVEPPYPNTDTLNTRRPVSRAISNLAVVPTISDLHFRTFSSDHGEEPSYEKPSQRKCSF